MTLQEPMEKLSQSLAECADWERRDYEGLIEWGDRLQEGGWLDTPEARVAYQREVWRAVASPVVWMWRKVRRD